MLHPPGIVLPEQVQAERSALLDELPGMVLLGQADDDARQIGRQGGVVDEGGDESAAALAGLSADEPQFPIEPGEQGRGGCSVHSRYAPCFSGIG